MERSQRRAGLGALWAALWAVCGLAVWGGVGLAQTPVPASAATQAGMSSAGSSSTAGTGGGSGAAGAQGGAAGAAQGMQFSDDSKFAVAGVTDWTAVGGHGSDAVLRTSEDLTRETVRLGDGAPDVAMDKATEDRLRAALAKAPESYAANRELGMYELRVGNATAAVPLLQRAVKLGGLQAGDEYELARACAGVGDTEAAEKHVQAALAKKDEARDHALMGELAERRGDAVGAVKEFARAAAMEPSVANTLAWGSELLLHRAIWEAEAVFAAGVKAHPDSARLKTAWGASLFAVARYDAAAEQLCAAADLEPKRAEPYEFLGKIALASVAPLPCVQGHLERFAAEQPGSAEAHYYLGMALAKQGDAAAVERGRAELERAVALDAKDGPAWVELGALATQRKETAEAMRDLERAVAADPGLSEAHYRLGVLYDRAGDKGRAQAEFAQHKALDRAEAAQTEKERREVKQFEVVRAGTQQQP